MPKNVGSPLFEEYLVNNLKSKEIEGKKEIAVFKTTYNVEAKHVGHY